MGIKRIEGYQIGSVSERMGRKYRGLTTVTQIKGIGLEGEIEFKGHVKLYLEEIGRRYRRNTNALICKVCYPLTCTVDYTVPSHSLTH